MRVANEPDAQLAHVGVVVRLREVVALGQGNLCQVYYLSQHF